MQQKCHVGFPTTCRTTALQQLTSKRLFKVGFLSQPTKKCRFRSSQKIRYQSAKSSTTKVVISGSLSKHLLRSLTARTRTTSILFCGPSSAISVLSSSPLITGIVSGRFVSRSYAMTHLPLYFRICRWHPLFRESHPLLAHYIYYVVLSRSYF